MPRRLCLVLVLVATLTVGAGAARADLMELVISLSTGNVTLRNIDSVDYDIVGYSIYSDVATFDSTDGVWTSIADTYDAGGTGSVDDNGEWTELSPPSATSPDLSEGDMFGDGGLLTPGQKVSLGAVWNTATPPDPALSVEIADTSSLLSPVAVFYRYDSDFDFDLDVDRDDLTVWRAFLGTESSLGDADGNGFVDGGDYLMWQREVGNVGLGFVLPGSGFGGVLAGSGAAVPEPTTAWLALVGWAGWLGWFRRHRWPGQDGRAI